MGSLIQRTRRWVGAVWLVTVVVVAVVLGQDGVWWVLATAVGGIVLGAALVRLPSSRRPRPHR